MSAPPTVSVVMCVHDGARHLAEAVDSALGQDGVEVELVVVDDGSQDATPDVLAGYGDALVALRQNQAGIGPARNRGIGVATGPLLTFLDADDRLPPGSLRVRVAALHADPHLEAAFGHARQFFSPELSEAERARLRLDPLLPAANVGGMVIRRAAWDRIGPFSDHRVGQGVEWMIRARDARLAARTLDDVVLERRVHEANQGRTTPQAERLAVLKAALDRRRAAPTDD